MKKLLLLLASSIVLLTISCRKDSFITGKDALIRLSSDTLFFDADGNLVKTVPGLISKDELDANLQAIAG